jgi:hypothetical protein
LVRARIRARQDADRLLLARLGSPLFDPLRPLLARLPQDRWPTHAELTALAARATTSRGVPLRFVPPRDRTDRERRYYELRIAESGEVETRSENWHDLFNALVWIAFPGAKAAINAQHAAILEEGGEAEAKHRGPARDALTVFDEGGVIVATSDAALRQLIVDFEWKELFWRRRAQLEAGVRFFAFGHALYEKGLDPYLGMVAKTVFVPFTADACEADRFLAAHFADRARFPSPKSMAPMPVLGIPGWHPDTARESFYDDARHFRGKTAPAA